MAAIEDFVSRFHSLDGVTLGEKQRSFRKLLNENTALLQDVNAVDNIVKKITPKTHLEDLLKLQILLHCRRIPELVDIFTSGNEVLISKIIKHDWFIKKVCQEKDAEQITNNLLPHLSYSVRMKVLKRISLYLNDDDKVYSIFEAVKHRYSLQVAMPLVLGCSVPHIEFVIKHNAVSFNGGELKHFIKKAPQLLPLYIEEYNKHYRNVSFIHNNDFLRYIASVDYNVYCHLKEKYKLDVNYGKRASRKLFEERKEEILDNLSYYENHLSKSIFVRKLGKYGHFRKYFLDAFSKKVEDFSCDRYSRIYSLLQLYPRNKRFQLLEQSFEEVYKIQMVNCPKQITKSILYMVSDVNKREKMVENKIQSDYLDNVDYLIYLPTSKSVPFIKKEMDLSANNIARRIQLIKALVKTCKINDDWNALKELLKYILARHRNDVEILENFLSFLVHKFDPHKFTRDLWNIMSEIINIYILKDGNLHRIRNILLAHLEFLYNSGESITELLLHYMKDNSSIVLNVFSYRCKDFKFIQFFVPLQISLLPKVHESDDVQGYCYCLTEPILKWNKEHQAHAIPIEDQVEVFDALREQGKKELFYCDLKLLICRKDRNDKIVEITSLYWEKHIRNLDIILYFLKWYPTVSRDYTESLIKALHEFHPHEVNKIFTWIRKYDHIKLPEKVLKCSIKLMDEKNQDNRHMVKYLSCLMNPEDYVNFVDKFKPKKLSVDIVNEQEKDIYKLQFQIIEGFSNLCSPIVLSQVFDYCGGDFLKFALVPLYKCFYRIPEEKLNPFLNRLVKNSVSVRKHAVFLAAQVCTQETVKSILKSASATEKNPSLQKRLILTSFNVLKQNASDDFWELFRYTLTLIDVNDKSTFQLLMGVSYVPIEYRLRYFEEMWNLLAKPGLPESNRYRFRNDLVSNIEPYVKDFPLTFCINVIETLFLKFSDNLDYINRPVNEFVLKFLLHHEDPERFSRIYQKLMDAKISSLNEPKLKSKTYIEIMNFITTFQNSFLSLGFSKYWNRGLLKDFIKKLCKIYPKLEFFDNYICLSLLNILINVNGANIKEYASKILEFCHSILDEHGPYAIECLESNIIQTFQYFEETLQMETVRANFIKELLEISKSELDYIIAFKVFIQGYENKDEDKNIIDTFKDCNYFYIQYMLREKDIFSVYK